MKRKLQITFKKLFLIGCATIALSCNKETALPIDTPVSIIPIKEQFLNDFSAYRLFRSEYIVNWKDYLQHETGAIEFEIVKSEAAPAVNDPKRVKTAYRLLAKKKDQQYDLKLVKIISLNEQSVDLKSLNTSAGTAFRGFFEYYSLEGEKLETLFIDDQRKIRKNVQSGLKKNQGMSTKNVPIECGTVTITYYERYCTSSGCTPWQVYHVEQYEVGNCTSGATTEERSEYTENNAQDKPCPGDPVKSPTIAPTPNNGLNGGRFGLTRGPGDRHDGLDIKAPLNSNLYSMYGGVVIETRNSFSPGQQLGKSYGNYVIVQSTLPSGEKIRIRYNHLNSVSVQKDAIISAGTNIGLSGNTGNAGGRSVVPHVDINVRTLTNGTWTLVNPEAYMKTKFDSTGNPINSPCL